MWHSGLAKSERFLGKFFRCAELVAIDDWIIFQDVPQVGEPSRWHFDAVNQNVKGHKTGGECDVEEVTVFVVSQMP